MSRSFGSFFRNSGVAAVPMMIFAAPLSSQYSAVPWSRMPPPTRQRAVAISSSMTARLFPVPRAASRSMTATSPATAKRRAMGRGSPASIFSVSPPTSWTALPPRRSMEGMITSGLPGLPPRGWP